MPCLHKLYNILILLRAFVTSEQFFSVDKEHQLPRCGHFVLGPQRSISSQSSLSNDNAQYSGLSERLIYVQDNITLTGYTKHSTPHNSQYCNRKSASTLVTSNAIYCCGGHKSSVFGLKLLHEGLDCEITYLTENKTNVIKVVLELPDKVDISNLTHPGNSHLGNDFANPKRIDYMSVSLYHKLSYMQGDLRNMYVIQNADQNSILLFNNSDAAYILENSNDGFINNGQAQNIDASELSFRKVEIVGDKTEEQLETNVRLACSSSQQTEKIVCLTGKQKFKIDHESMQNKTLQPRDYEKYPWYKTSGYEIWNFVSPSDISYKSYELSEDELKVAQQIVVVDGVQLCGNFIDIYGYSSEDTETSPFITKRITTDTSINPIANLCDGGCDKFITFVNNSWTVCQPTKHCETMVERDTAIAPAHYEPFVNLIRDGSKFQLPNCLPENKNIAKELQETECRWDVFNKRNDNFMPKSYILYSVCGLVLTALIVRIHYFQKRDKYGFIKFKSFDKFYLVGNVTEIHGGSADVMCAWYTTGQIPRLFNVEIQKVALKQYRDYPIGRVDYQSEATRIFCRQPGVQMSDRGGPMELLFNWQRLICCRLCVGRLEPEELDLKNTTYTAETTVAASTTARMNTHQTTMVVSSRDLETYTMDKDVPSGDSFQESRNPRDACHKFKNNYELRKIKLMPTRVNEFKREIRILSMVQGPTTVSAIGYYRKDGIVLVMEWYPSTLENVLTHEETKLKRFHYTENLLYCMVDLQSKNPSALDAKLSGGLLTTLFTTKSKKSQRQWIVHGDLHANNVFIDGNDNLRLGDFGNSKIVKNYYECDKDLLCLLSLLESVWQVHNYNTIPAAVNWLFGELNDLVRTLETDLRAGTSKKKSGRKKKEKDKLLTSRDGSFVANDVSISVDEHLETSMSMELSILGNSTSMANSSIGNSASRDALASGDFVVNGADVEMSELSSTSIKRKINNVATSHKLELIFKEYRRLLRDPEWKGNFVEYDRYQRTNSRSNNDGLLE